MKKENTIRKNNLFAGGLHCILLLIISFFVIVGCSSTKKISSSVNESSSVTSSDSLISIKKDSVNTRLNEKIKDLEGEIEWYGEHIENANDVISELQSSLYDSSMTLEVLREKILSIKPCPKCPDAKIKFNTDGSFEASGPLKSANIKLSQAIKERDSLRAVLAAIKSSSETNIETSSDSSINSSKRSSGGIRLFYWIFFIAGYLLCLFFHQRIKNLYNKILSK